MIGVIWRESVMPVTRFTSALAAWSRHTGMTAPLFTGGNMPVRATPQDATSKWVTNLSGATERIKAGVGRVTTAPGQQAAAQSQKWLQRVTASHDKWRSRVAAVSLSSWQQSMVEVGVPRVAQGAQAKQDKYTSFATEFFPYLDQGVRRIDQMPSTTLEDNINRAVAMIRHNAGFKRGSSGRSGG